MQGVILHQPFIIPAIALIVVSLPLIAQAIPPNRFYGVRTRAALADKDVWYRINKRFGIGGTIAGIFYLLVMMACPYDGEFTLFLLHLSAFAVPLLLALFLSLRPHGR